MLVGLCFLGFFVVLIVVTGVGWGVMSVEAAKSGADTGDVVRSASGADHDEVFFLEQVGLPYYEVAL